METSIRNIDTVARKLGPASTRATNDRLEVAREERQKREKMIDRWKAEAIAAKRCRARGKISLSSEKEDKSDIGDNIDPNQANLDQADDIYLVEL